MKTWAGKWPTPQLVTDQQKYQKTAKAHRDLEDIVGKYRDLKQANQGIGDAKSMLNESDPELAAMAQEELTRLEAQASALEEEIKVMLLPTDPNDEKNVCSRNSRRHRRRRGLHSLLRRHSACIRVLPNSIVGRWKFYRSPNPE